MLPTIGPRYNYEVVPNPFVIVAERQNYLRWETEVYSLMMTVGDGCWIIVFFDQNQKGNIDTCFLKDAHKEIGIPIDANQTHRLRPSTMSK